MKLTGFPIDYRANSEHNLGVIPGCIDLQQLGDSDANRGMLLFADESGDDVYIDGVTDTQWVVGRSYGANYHCLGVFDNFPEALEVAQRHLRLAVVPIERTNSLGGTVT